MTGLSPLDRPNSYIGRSVPRPNLARLLQGRGQYVSDLVLPRMVHVAFVRSPYAHARILRIDCEAARTRPGVVAVNDWLLYVSWLRSMPAITSCLRKPVLNL